MNNTSERVSSLNKRQRKQERQRYSRERSRKDRPPKPVRTRSYIPSKLPEKLRQKRNEKPPPKIIAERKMTPEEQEEFNRMFERCVIL